MRMKCNSNMGSVPLFLFAVFCGMAMILGIAAHVHAHSVGQVQTTKFFHPDTVQMLKDRAIAGHPGFQVGDTVSYIIQYTPIANGATTGVAGYITDYIPSGAEVIGASVVAKDGSGNYYDISPSLPANICNRRASNTFLAPFNVNTYDPTGLCAAGGFTNNCNARIDELYADTGIFYSTDPRTAQYPALPTRIAQGTNGYYINPTGAGGLNTLLGQANGTTHNLWDAEQTNAFGTNALTTLTPNANSYQGVISSAGRGATPFFAGAAVAGPQTGYQFDNTGSAGPWQRIYYPGSRMGNASRGPQTVFGACTPVLGGFYTSAGWNLSSSNPLPSGTNAVRWATGKIVVGEMRYVKISLRLTQPVPSGGFINGSEVFGGDAGDADGGQDNTWRYHIPSVADNNSNLFVLKEVIGYNCLTVAPFTCTSGSGSYISANSKIRYRITYLNSGNGTQTNIVLSDTLPCQTGAAPVSYNGVANTVNIVSGPITAPAAATLSGIPAGTNGTSCAVGSRRTFSFPTLASLGPGAGGTIEFDVLTNAANGSTVPNTATLTSAQISPGINSTANSYVATAPNLSITKTTSTPTVASGGTATYTITVTNSGTAAATSIIVYDLLPTTGGAANAATRFSYAATTSIVGMTAVVPTTAVPPTLTPYSTDAKATNWQQVSWNFGAQTLAVGASFTITFTATIGASVPASATPYYNTAVVTYTGGTVTRADVVNTAGVTVTSALSVTKTLTHFYDATAGWVAYANYIPTGAKVRYKIDYSNTGAGAVTNAVLSDTLPCQTAAAPVSYNGVANTVNIVSGPIAAVDAATPLSGILAGNCATSTRRTFNFAAATINAGQSGQIIYDVQTNAATGNTVTNTVSLSGTGASPVTSEVQATALLAPSLSISKQALTTGVKAGQTVTYTLTVTNTGTSSANYISVHDWLPSSGGTTSATRFSYASTASIWGMTSVTASTSVPPTSYPSSGNTQLSGTVTVASGSTAVTGTGTSFTTELAVNDTIYINGNGYRVSAIASNTSLTLATAATAAATNATATKNSWNQEEVVWNFGSQGLAAGSSFTITFTATVGASVPPGSYNNYSRVYWNSSPLTGTAAVTYNSATVTGTGTSFNTQLTGGSLIAINGAYYTVSTIASATSLTLTTAYTGNTATGLTLYEGSQANSQAASVTVSAYAADIAVTKTDSRASIVQGSATTYVIVATNNGPDAANNTRVFDGAVKGLSKTGVICAASGGAVCPGTLTVAALEGNGLVIPTFPSGGQITLTVTANNTALTGTIAVTNGSATVTGTGTLFTTELVAGDSLSINGVYYTVSTIASATSLTLTTSYAGTTASGLTSYKGSVTNSATADPMNLSGTVAVTNGSSTVTGTGTAFLTQLTAGDIVSLNGAYYTVSSVTNDTTLVLTAAYTGTTSSGIYIYRAIADTNWNNNTASDTDTITLTAVPDLSTSTKTWQDQNGGEQNPNDVIRYTITLRETAGSATTGVSVTDTFPTTLTTLTVVICPPGATCSFAGQTLTASGISVGASGSVTIVIDATIISAAAPGTTINNCATVTNPSGYGASPCASTITVSASQVAGSGNKPLYLWDATGAQKLSRSKMTPNATSFISVATGAPQTWTLNPVLQSSVQISGNIPVSLYLASGAAGSYTPQIDLLCGATVVATENTIAVTLSATATLFSFTLPLATPYTCAAGSAWALNVAKFAGAAGSINVYPAPAAGQYSNVSLPSLSLITVTSVTPYSTVYPGTTSPAIYPAGTPIYLRAVVSDPFGSYDIASATITIKDPNNTTIVSSAAMTQVADSGAATKTFEYTYNIPSSGPAGWWSVTVTAVEGTEGTVTVTGAGTFYVSTMPSITVVKSVQTYSDPVNGTTSPKAIPGSFMTYTITVINSGAGGVDNNTTVITDPIPANTELFVGDIGGAGSGPVLFTTGAACSAGTAASGLSYSFISLADLTDNISFSDDGGVSYGKVNTAPDANNCDTTVTNVKVSLSGIFNGTVASGGSNTSFCLQFRARVK